MTAPAKPSPVEGFKEQSHFLRGDMATELVDGNDHFGKASETLLKYHGTYQQDDRDDRGAARHRRRRQEGRSRTSSWSAPRFPAAS